MVRFFRYILSKLFKKNNYNVSITVTKFAIKKIVYKKEKDSTYKPHKHE